MTRRTTAWLSGWAMAAVFAASAVRADDWPMWRHDAQRSGATQEAIGASMRLRWVRQLPALTPAYHNARLQFDAGYEPIIRGRMLIVASSLNHSVSGYDIASGRLQWRFYTGGPVRFAPAAWKDKLYVGSDDGWLYCLNSLTGEQVWRFRAAPSNRKLLGNGRLISVWPVRGGPVAADGRVYFAAGVWSFEGIFVYALDAETGETIWVNDRTGFIYGTHPHAAEAFGGVTPQGYLVLDGDDLIVPCGAAYPATFDAKTGELKQFELPRAGREPGGWYVSKDLRRGAVVLDRDVNADRHEDRPRQGQGEAAVRTTVRFGERDVDFAKGVGESFPEVNGQVHTMIAANGYVIVVTREGGIYCYSKAAGDGDNAPAAGLREPRGDLVGGVAPMRYVEAALRQTPANRGYFFVLGLTDGRVMDELVARHADDLHVIGLSSDAQLVRSLRERFDAAAVYGHRVTVLRGDVMTSGLPPYAANLVLAEDAAAAGIGEGERFVEAVHQLLRPYGGVAAIGLTDEQARHVKDHGFKPTDLKHLDQTLWILRRNGALPGAVNYTGGWQSPDAMVKAPFGVLWFDDSLGHFKRSPQPMIVDGVMVSQPKDWLAGDKPPYRLLPAVFSDVYTGRVMSPDELPDEGRSLPMHNVDDQQPSQYRPPTQKDAWNPAPPRPGERVNPLTGLKEPRTFPKSYGCDGGIDYGYLYTMRSGTAAVYDKRTESGTFHISGPRSGCTNSVIPACGVLNVPYFYVGCTCSYPLPMGLAMVSMPATHEQWTSFGDVEAPADGPRAAVQRLGLNFGAPGDRVTDAGTLWLDYPSVGGPSPKPDVQITGAEADDAPTYHYRHSLWIEGGEGWPWVAASCVQGVRRVKLSNLKPGKYTVRLVFAEPDHAAAGGRVFDVAIADRTVLEHFDPHAVGGGRMRAVTRQFDNVPVEGDLIVTLTPRAGRTLLSGIEVVHDNLPPDTVERLPDNPHVKQLER